MVNLENFNLKKIIYKKYPGMFLKTAGIHQKNNKNPIKTTY